LAISLIAEKRFCWNIKKFR